MNFCSKCGAQLAPGAAVCGNCGTPTGASAPGPTQPQFAAPSSAEMKGFMGSLFDLSFSHFITTKLVKILFILGLIGTAFYCLFFIVTLFTQSAIAGVVGLILSPLIALFGVIYLRVLMEMLIVIFRAAEHLAELVELTRQKQ